MLICRKKTPEVPLTSAQTNHPELHTFGDDEGLNPDFENIVMDPIVLEEGDELYDDHENIMRKRDFNILNHKLNFLVHLFDSQSQYATFIGIHALVYEWGKKFTSHQRL
ncbi:hypothetical protein L2E82_33435 [Cichorium intybus]|uniref:Uncharacterized protein n=1 Tax=Cichorium intybus TaxID=13427 RepID=A0ACB9BK48_CICIN|nr:hypothetical protein L2E82_33435 [Cichorium intybus]